MPKHANIYVYIVKILSKKLQTKLESCNSALYCIMSHQYDPFPSIMLLGDAPFRPEDMPIQIQDRV